MILSLLLACTTAPKLTATVGKAGLQVDLPGGASLDIPEGALSEDVEITATLVTDLEASGVTPITEGFEAPAFAISLEPHGLTFDKPVTLTLPADGIGDFPEVMRAEYDLDPDWEGVGPVTVADGVATVEIDGFSVYALTLVKDGSCPCFDRGDVETYYKVGRADGAYESSNTDGSTVHDFLPRGSGLYLYSAHRGNGDDQCRATARWTPPAPSPAARYFPDLTSTYSSGDRWERNFQAISTAEHTACSALIVAGIAGTPGRQIVVSVHGLTASTDTVTVEDSVSGEGYALSGDDIPFVIADGADYSLSVTEAPAGMTCAFEGADPLVGTATADVEADILCYPTPSATAEVPCNLQDDDGDGLIDESATGDVTDTDGDGLVDVCDAHPTLGCDCFKASDVAPALAWDNAECLAASPSVPTTDVFTGVAAGQGDDLYRVLGTAYEPDSDLFVCGNGCFDALDSKSARCEEGGYGGLVSYPLADETAYQACNDIVLAGCY